MKRKPSPGEGNNKPNRKKQPATESEKERSGASAKAAVPVTISESAQWIIYKTKTRMELAEHKMIAVFQGLIEGQEARLKEARENGDDWGVCLIQGREELAWDVANEFSVMLADYLKVFEEVIATRKAE